MKAHNISTTIDSNLCVGCGLCDSICPKGAISMKVLKSVVSPAIDEDFCIQCGICLNACPGIGVNLLQQANVLFHDAEIQEHKYIGRYLKNYIGHSNDANLRSKAASGGALSQFLIWLLETKKIDGALVTRFDKESPLLVKSFIACTKEEIISAKGSKYSPVSLNEGLAELKKTEHSRYVIVGLPCHIQGLRKQMTFDKSLRKKVIGLFSLFCSGTQTFNYTKYILSQCGGNVKDLQYLAYREGSPSGMVAKGTNFDFFRDYSSYNVPLKSTFYPKRCLLCVDMFGELADIAFGDIHIDDPNVVETGIDALIVRNKYWQTLLQEAGESGAISLSEITVEQMLYKRTMAKVKKNRNSAFVALLNKLHIPAPCYDSGYTSKVDLKIALRYSVMRAKQFIGNHKCLWFLLPKLK